MQTYEIHFVGKDGIDRTLSTGWTFSEGWDVVKDMAKRRMQVLLVTPGTKKSS